MVFGKTIYEYRKKKGLTLSELAERSKISKSYLSNIERNLNRNPSIQVVRKIAAVLDVDLETFLSPLHTHSEKQEVDQELIEFAMELKETGIEKEQIDDYKTLIEFIKWQNQKEKVLKD
ncbi:helix-turn-helix transcriptional regulator [Bacillus sp. 1P10SD]|uniref:helix-turn-helix domain-containing protein n=1 Tax=Bacillus sp. 1P10SD TaxID=3132265 RepID=UPI0039A61DD8